MLQLIKNDFSKYKTNVPTNKVKLLFKAPLAFLGQKRNWIRYLPNLCSDKLLDNNSFGKYSNSTWVDMFGGSGLLSHNLKLLMPRANVIYNDFDGYTNYLTEESIQILLEINSQIRVVLKKYEKYPKAIKLSDDDAQSIRTVIDAYYNYYGDKLYRRQVYSWIVFSAAMMDSIETIARKEKFWHRGRNGGAGSHFEKHIANWRNYLKGVNILKHVDFKILLDKYKNDKNVVLIADPPYLNTTQGDYKGGFNKEQFDYLIDNLRPPFIAFSSSKNELCNILKERYPKAQIENKNIFIARGKSGGAHQKVSDVKYTDQMIFCAGD